VPWPAAAAAAAAAAADSLDMQPSVVARVDDGVILGAPAAGARVAGGAGEECAERLQARRLVDLFSFCGLRRRAAGLVAMLWGLRLVASAARARASAAERR
jgi:hypothetical protein